MRSPQITRFLSHVLFFLLCLSVSASDFLTRPTAAQPYRHLNEQHLPLAVESLAQWQERASWLRDHIWIGTGLRPLPEKTPLDPQTTPLSAQDGYSVQGVALETYPGFYLTGTLYRPVGEGPFPAILTPHGHWSTGRFENTELASIPGRSLTLARQGYVVFSYSMIGYNETQNLFPHRFDEPAYQLWGFSAMGLQLWNSLRALDYLASLPFVDAERIGITGASGGGTQTFMLSAVDDRIRAAAPVNMISAHFQGGCICENGPLLRQDANNMEIGALMAPRPLLLISTSGDWTTHTPEVEYPSIRGIYRLFGLEDRVANVHFDYPHNYNKDTRHAVYEWLARWLQDASVEIDEKPFTLPPESAMTAPLPQPPPSPEALFETYRAAAARQIGDPPDSWSAWQKYTDTFGTAFRHLFHHEPPAESPAPDLRDSPLRATSADAVLIVHASEDAGRAEALAESYMRQGKVVSLLSPYPEGDTFTPPDSIEYWTTYNPTVAMRRVQAIQDAAEALHRHPGIGQVDLHGIGPAGVWTLLARSQLSFVRNTHVDFDRVAYTSNEDFLENAYIPLLRRVGDFKTAAALTLPGSLTIENLPDGELRTWILALYDNLGALDLLEIR